MNSTKRFVALFFCLALMVSCELSPSGVTIPELEGREPEVVTWVSGRQWFPSTIALVASDQEGGHIYLEANSSANKGYKRTMRLNIIDSQFEWVPLDTLDLLDTHLPTRVSVEYEQFRDKTNLNSSKWLGDTNDLGGLRITKLEKEDGVLYAAGEFFMSPYIFNNRIDIQKIEGIFNNIRVFESEDEMRLYFQHITALEAAGQ